jgi:hypothetical protein
LRLTEERLGGNRNPYRDAKADQALLSHFLVPQSGPLWLRTVRFGRRQAGTASSRNWKPETGNRRLETGDWRLETGDWKLETGNRQ